MTYQFESGVNPEGIQTETVVEEAEEEFESGVNPEGIQTIFCGHDNFLRLRVV